MAKDKDVKVVAEEEEVTEVNKDAEVVEEPLKITKEELESVKQGRLFVTNSTLEAEKAVAVKKIADLELKNTILSIYNKYKLTAGVDSILEDGTVVQTPGE